jgi:hypothetical protein
VARVWNEPILSENAPKVAARMELHWMAVGVPISTDCGSICKDFFEKYSVRLRRRAGAEHQHFTALGNHSARHECQSKVRMTGRVSSSCAAPRCNLEFELLNRDEIKLARRLFVKQGAFFLISTTPVFVSSRYSQEVTRADALLAPVVFV